MTGAGLLGGGSLAQMFNFRQSSFVPGRSPPAGDTWGHGAGGVVALISAEGAAGCGGFQRLPPAVDAAYGTPRKAHDSPRSLPWTSPLLVVTRQEPPWACTWRISKCATVK